MALIPLAFAGQWTITTAYNPGDIVYVDPQPIQDPGPYGGRTFTARGLYLCLDAAIAGSQRPPGTPNFLNDSQGRRLPNPLPLFGTWLDLGSAGPERQQGPQGPAGPPGTTWRGPYQTNTAYNRNDLVSSGGSVWIALQDVPAGQQPGQASSSTQNYWGVFVNSGMPRFVGNWTAGTYYFSNDVVSYQNKWYSLIPPTGVSTGFSSNSPPTSDTTHWQLLLDMPSDPTVQSWISTVVSMLSLVASVSSFAFQVDRARRQAEEMAAKLTESVQREVTQQLNDAASGLGRLRTRLDTLYDVTRRALQALHEIFGNQ